MGHSNKLVLIWIIAMLSVNLAAALGVSSPYWNENPLKMYPGESREVPFVLVNGINEPTTSAKILLSNGSNIAKITSKTSYTLQPGDNNQVIKLKIDIPQSAKISDSYDVGFVVRYTPEGGEGTVKLDVEYKVNFPVNIVSREDASALPEETGEAPSKTSMWIFLAVLAVLVIIAFLIILRYKKNQR